MAKGDDEFKIKALEMAVEVAKTQFTAMREKEQIETSKILADAADFLAFLIE